MYDELTGQVIDVLKRVCQAERRKFPTDVNSSTRLEVLDLNSLLFIKFIVRLEVDLDIDFDDENMDISNFFTIGDIVKYVEQRKDLPES